MDSRSRLDEKPHEKAKGSLALPIAGRLLWSATVVTDGANVAFAIEKSETLSANMALISNVPSGIELP